MNGIGVFDSGYGGLTILKSLQAGLPNYDFIYLGDNQRAPYGTRTFQEVYEFTLEAVIKLFEMGCPLIILACNTASAKALRTIQQNYLPSHFPNRRVLGVIRPSAEVVGQLSKTQHIGLLATEGTVKSNSYELELNKFSPHITLHQQACPTWVNIIESNQHRSESGKNQIKHDLEELLHSANNIDTIILACTHYPIIFDYLRAITPQHINIVSQGNLVTESLIDYLARHPKMESRLTKNGNTQYFTTGIVDSFNLHAKQIIGFSPNSKHLVL